MLLSNFFREWNGTVCCVRFSATSILYTHTHIHNCIGHNKYSFSSSFSSLSFTTFSYTKFFFVLSLPSFLFHCIYFFAFLFSFRSLSLSHSLSAALSIFRWIQCASSTHCSILFWIAERTSIQASIRHTQLYICYYRLIHLFGVNSLIYAETQTFTIAFAFVLKAQEHMLPAKELSVYTAQKRMYTLTTDEYWL